MQVLPNATIYMDFANTGRSIYFAFCVVREKGNLLQGFCLVKFAVKQHYVELH